MTARVILIRHGQPAIALRPKILHPGFADYIAAYEQAGLDPADTPPQALRDLVGNLDAVFASDRPRSRDSAQRLLPNIRLIADPLFAEAPLASPPIPLLAMTAPAWAVVSRILWHAGFHPGIENYRRANRRAAQAADTLIEHARAHGVAVLVAHGYFNWMIGRHLKKRGFSRYGTHLARYWNTVIYEKAI